MKVLGDSVQIIDRTIEHVADCAVGQDRLNRFKERIPAQQEAGHAADVVLAHRRVQFPQSGQIERDRFLHHHVFTRLHARHPLLDVQVVRRADRYHLDIRGLKQLIEVRVGAAIGEPVLARFGFRPGAVAAQDGPYLDARVRIKGLDVFAGTSPVPNTAAPTCLLIGSPYSRTESGAGALPPSGRL